MKLPVVDAPVDAIGSSSVLPTDSEGLPKDPVDRRIEMAVRKSFEVAAGTLKASVASSLFIRVTYLWAKGLIKNFDIRRKLRRRP